MNLPGIPTCYAHDTRKTEVLLGYRPRYDVFAMIDEAVGRQAGEVLTAYAGSTLSPGGRGAQARYE